MKNSNGPKSKGIFKEIAQEYVKAKAEEREDGSKMNLPIDECMHAEYGEEACPNTGNRSKFHEICWLGYDFLVKACHSKYILRHEDEAEAHGNCDCHQ